MLKNYNKCISFKNGRTIHVKASSFYLPPPPPPPGHALCSPALRYTEIAQFVGPTWVLSTQYQAYRPLGVQCAL